MNRQRSVLTLIVGGWLVANASAFGATSEVPEPFRAYDPASTYRIEYDDLDYILKRVVVDVGRSDREKAEAPRAPTGSRMRTKVKTLTIKEGNRFNFQAFKDNDVAREALLTIQHDLEQLPTGAPLKYFNRKEQLAYWLNLYNVTLINEIIKVYPENKLKKFLDGRDSVLSRKILNVAGVPLSLDDIQYTILENNYDHDPLIIYGLYQGIIGGPNILKLAYTGTNVYTLLKHNALEFINSNRGTQSERGNRFRVSSLYDRNREYFPDFQSDLKTHLLAYLDDPERGELQAASTIRPDIDDWTITDLLNSMPRIGGSFADNSAALLHATHSSTAGSEPGLTDPAPSSVASNQVLAKARVAKYVAPELINYLHDLKLKQDVVNLKKGTVIVEELGEVPEGDEPRPKAQDKDHEDH
jgi:hypothetical protein